MHTHTYIEVIEYPQIFEYFRTRIHARILHVDDIWVTKTINLIKILQLKMLIHAY